MTAPDGDAADRAVGDAADRVAGDTAEAELASAVDRIRRRVAHWTPARWSVAPSSGAAGATRAELVHALVQRIADLAAQTEGEPRRDVPRLDNDLALCDQLVVVAADLGAARPAAEVLTEATELVGQAHRAL